MTIDFDAPVPAGTTDYNQFILGAQDAGVEGVSLSLGEQEAVQVLRAADQLDSDLQIALGTGTFSHQAAAELGDFAENMVFDNAFPPATVDVPVYAALRADLAASGEDAPPAGHPAQQPDAFLDRPLRAAQDDPRRRHDRLHEGGRDRDARRGRGRADARHLRR